MKLTEARHRYLEILNDEEWRSATEIAALVGKSASGVAKCLSGMHQDGLLAWQAPSDYAIRPAGRAALADQKQGGETAALPGERDG